MMDILPQLLVNALIQGSIYALASAGLSLSYGTLKILNFAHGHLLMLGAYIFYFFVVSYEQPIWVSGIACALFMLLMAVFTLNFFILPFIRYSFILVFVTTLAFSTILESVVAMLFGVEVKTLTTQIDYSTHEFYGVFITDIQILIIVSAAVLLGLVALVIHATPFGRTIRSLSEFSQGAEALGIDQKRNVSLVFIVSVLLASYAGILIGYETNLQPTMGNAYTIKAFAAMILGGLGNIWGTIFGSYILGLIENLAVGLDLGDYSIPAGYKDAFAFAIILGVLLVRPQGLFNRASRKA